MLSLLTFWQNFGSGGQLNPLPGWVRDYHHNHCTCPKVKQTIKHGKCYVKFICKNYVCRNCDVKLFIQVLIGE